MAVFHMGFSRRWKFTWRLWSPSPTGPNSSLLFFKVVHLVWNLFYTKINSEDDSTFCLRILLIFCLWYFLNCALYKFCHLDFMVLAIYSSSNIMCGLSFSLTDFLLLGFFHICDSILNYVFPLVFFKGNLSFELDGRVSTFCIEDLESSSMGNSQ